MDTYRDRDVRQMNRLMNAQQEQGFPVPPPESPLAALLDQNDKTLETAIDALSTLSDRLYPVLQPEPPAGANQSSAAPTPPNRLVLSRLERHNRGLLFILAEIQRLRDRLVL